MKTREKNPFKLAEGEGKEGGKDILSHSFITRLKDSNTKAVLQYTDPTTYNHLSQIHRWKYYLKADSFYSKFLMESFPFGHSNNNSYDYNLNRTQTCFERQCCFFFLFVCFWLLQHLYPLQYSKTM